MISFHYQNNFNELDTWTYREWLSNIAKSEDLNIRKLDYVFCDDEYLLGINQQFLDHDTLTDIITFDYSSEGMVEGEIYISTERVKENADEFSVEFDSELQRVMAHGLLHLAGYGDKTEAEQIIMRDKESEKIDLFHVKQ